MKRALPTARIGGPHVTGRTARARRSSCATSRALPARHELRHRQDRDRRSTSSPSTPRARRAFVDGHVRMGVSNQLRAIANGFAIVASFPELKDTPIVIGESDPEGCAACPVRTNPQNAYRNGTMYSSYTAEQIARNYELADLHKVNLLGSVTWAFEFEDQPYFDGFRDLATNGIDKPVLNVFRMLGQMGGDRVSVESTARCRSRPCATSASASAPTSMRSRAAGALGRDPRLELSRRRSAGAGCRCDPDDRGPARLESCRSRTTASTRPQQLLRSVEEDGLAAASVKGPAGRAREGRRALRGRADPNGHEGRGGLSNVPVATSGRIFG